VIASAAPPSSAAADSPEDIKAALRELVDGTERGIFGVKSERRTAITEQVAALEASVAAPAAPLAAEHLPHLGGEWEVLFSTITILGKRRTRLGLRTLVSIEDLVQSIDVERKRSSNVVSFSVRGFSEIRGSLTIDATWEIASPQRVDISFEKSSMEPQQLQELFEDNYDMLLEIFNPEGWLETTYVDADFRIGRDNKENIFILQRKGR